MSNIGFASLAIIPSMRGISGEVSKGLGGIPAIGKRAGEQLGQGIADGVEAKKAAVEKAADQVAKLRNREADAAGKVRVAEAQLQSLRDKGIQDAGRLAAAEERVEKAHRDLTAAQKATADSSDSLARAQKLVVDSADDARSSVKGFSTALDDVGGSARSSLSDLGEMAAGAAGIASAMELATSAMDFESVTAKMNASMGASGPLAEQYGKAAGELWSKGLGESMDDVGAAVTAVQSSFTALGSEGEVSIEKAAERALNLAKIFDIDVNEAVQTASQLIVNGLANDSTQAMDLMTAAMQRVPAAMRDELPEIINEYGTNFRALGFSGEQAFALLVSAADEGKWALDKTGDALKEFTIRGADLSQTSTDAFRLIGLDAEQMANKIASGGPAAQQALQQTAQGLLDISNPAERANAAIALFGTPLEDLSVDQIPAFLESLSGGENSMAGFQGAADEAGAALNDTAQNKLTTFGRELQSSVIEKLGTAAGFLQDHPGLMWTLAGAVAAVSAAYIGLRIAAAASAIAQGVQAAATGAGTAALAGNTLAAGAHAVASGIVTVATSLWSVAQWILNAAFLANPLTWIVIGIMALIGVIILIATKTTWFQTVWEAVWNAVKVAWNFVWNLLKAGFNALVGFFTVTIPNALGIVKQFFIDRWNDIKGFFETTWNTLKGWFEELAAFFTDTIPEAAGKAKDWIVEKFTAIVDFVKGLPRKIADAAKGMWDGIKNAFKDTINTVIGWWNNFRLHFEFTIPVIDKKVSLTIDTPDIPTLAGGGVAGRHRDGRLWGPGTGTSDSILALDAFTGVPTAFVSTGEFVVNAKATERFLPLLQAINGGRSLFGGGLPRFAAGGLVAGSRLDPMDGEGGLKPMSVLVRRLIGKLWSQITDIGGYRASDPFPDHPSGQALDIMITDVPLGDAVLAWLEDNLSLFHLDYTIWQQRYKPAGGEASLMEDRGSPTQNHMDHIHALFGKVGSPPAANPDVVPEGIKWPAGMEPEAAPSTESPSTADPADPVTPETPTPTTPTAPAQEQKPTIGTTISGIAGKAVEGQVQSLLGVLGIGDSPPILGAIDEAQRQQNEQQSQTDPAAVAPTDPADPAAPETPKPDRLPGWEGYAFDITEQAKKMNLVKRAAIIGNATALVEAGDPLKMWANRTVPESLQFPHDAVGSENDSIGLFQQRGDGAWGTVADRMDPHRSAKMFYDALVKIPSWESMDMGAAAQAVQRSAFPGKYAQKIGRATELVDKAKLYDSGGWLPKGLTMTNNESGDVEPILTRSQWADAHDAITIVKRQIAEQSGTGEPVPQVIYNIQTARVEDAFLEARKKEEQRMTAKMAGL